jgi:suppressor for copper-sensitivity B
MAVQRQIVVLAAALTGLVAGGLAAAPARAAGAASEWVRTDQTALRLVSAVEGTGDARSVLLGLHFRLDPGWKVYWRSAGDAGYPPRVNWSGSQNLAEAHIDWPAPLRFSVLGFETLGYKDEVVLPVAVRLSEPGQPLALAADVDYLTCNEVCIPYQAKLSLDLPAGAAHPSPFAHLINRFVVRVPGPSHGVTVERIGQFAGPAGTVVRVEATALMPFAAPDVYLEGPPELTFGAPRVALRDGGRRALLDVDVAGADKLKAPLAETRLTATVVDGERAADRLFEAIPILPAGTAPLPAMAKAVTPIATGLAAMLGLALVGGLILNLMPCVLPVLSLKLLSVVGHGGGERGHVRLSFVASAAGIVAAFLTLAGGLVALKAGGAAIGWGIQFQQPWFLIAMTLVVTLFAANLWGLFEIGLPSWVGALDERAHRVRGVGGHFLSGVFATLLATPCTAPFLGTAVGFALARGAAEIFAVFAALGVGMALPYLAVAAVPSLATRLPRPGRWMERLKQLLGLALAATAGWLLTVLGAVVGAAAAAAIGGLMAAAALFLRHRLPVFRRVGGALVATLALLAFFVPAQAPSSPAGGPPPAKADAGIVWQPFDPEAIARLVGEGKVVFVDVTADWCITCQVNKALVINQGEVARRLKGDVVALRADWTRPSDEIAHYLAGFGRYGIPFNAIYGPAAPAGIVLPELLTEADVLAALDRAVGRPAVATR